MNQISKILIAYKSMYAASKALKVTATQLDRLKAAGAIVDDTGQVWIKSKTVLDLS